MKSNKNTPKSTFQGQQSISSFFNRTPTNIQQSPNIINNKSCMYIINIYIIIQIQ